MSALTPVAVSTITLVIKNLATVAVSGVAITVLERLFEDLLIDIGDDIEDTAKEHQKKTKRFFTRDDLGTFNGNFNIEVTQLKYFYIQISVANPLIYISRKPSIVTTTKDEFFFGHISFWAMNYCLEVLDINFQKQDFDIQKYYLPVTSIHLWTDKPTQAMTVYGVIEQALSTTYP